MLMKVLILLPGLEDEGEVVVDREGLFVRAHHRRHHRDRLMMTEIEIETERGCPSRRSRRTIVIA
jgi:hypothetical protein